MWSDVSLSLAGLSVPLPGAGEVDARGLIERVGVWGYRWVQLDCAMPTLRPRELDRSARRDLASLLRREGLMCSGLDLWIPPAHFAEAARADRAVEATVQGAELLAELTRLGAARGVLCVMLPENPAQGVEGALIAACERQGVEIADHRVPLRDGGVGLGPGIDPAAAVMAGLSPAAEVMRMAGPVRSARLSDVSGAGRVAYGTGRVERMEYEVALTTKGFTGAVVVDLRTVADQIEAAAAVLESARGG
jgi:sugar phosphate isomerase/epimerase